MAILIEKNLCTIHTKHSTYQMALSEYGHLLHLYYGARIGEDEFSVGAAAGVTESGCNGDAGEHTENGPSGETRVHIENGPGGETRVHIENGPGGETRVHIENGPGGETRAHTESGCSSENGECMKSGESAGQPDLRYLLTYLDRGFSGNPYDAGTDRTFSLDALPQEYPCFGTGDYRSAALQICDEEGVCSCDLRFRSARVLDGKYGIPGMPAVYVEAPVQEASTANENILDLGAGLSEADAGAKITIKAENESESERKPAQTLEIVLEDRVSGIEVTLLYGVLSDSDVITRAARIRNNGTKTVHIEKAASCCLDFLYGDFDLISFHGRHGMERQFERKPLTHTEQILQSRRGASSHQQNPFFILAGKDATETSGDCYGFQLLYSGNFKGEAAVDQYRQTRTLLGISDELFSWELRPQEVFDTPEAVLCYSAEGFEKLSAEYHSLLRKHVCRGIWRDKRRPVLLNSWEAAYFDFDGDKLLQIARQAAELGVEMLVVDDGWFGKRDDDNSGLGDWVVNEKKLGCTLGEVAERVNALGMQFGLWIEPEMVSEDSDLYRAHPDWAFAIPGRRPVRGRNQLVLDFSRKEVVDYILDAISDVIAHANIAYIKMDMNRHLTDIYSLNAREQNQGATLHRYVLGVYDFLERLEARFPEILVEGCSGGGGRFDAGMLYYTPQIWCSDNTDAIERLRIQYGTSFGYPISAVGSHVSAVPNHQTGRYTDIATRGVVAMAGTFGYELDLNRITESEKETVRLQIQDYIRYSDLIREGHYSRLTNPTETEEYVAWEFSAEDGSEALLNLVWTAAHYNAPTEYVRLRGLDPAGRYRIEETESTCARQSGSFKGRKVTAGESRVVQACIRGDVLMAVGLPVPRMIGEYRVWQLHLKKQ